MNSPPTIGSCSNPPETPQDLSTEMSDDITEIDFDLGNLNENETIKITHRNEVYYKMYQDAIKKAKEARTLAISTYLEAKHIQKLYMLDEINDIHETLDEV